MDLESITDDLLARVETGDGNMLSGLNSFIKMYKKLQSLTSPTPSIAHALHQFGKMDSKCEVSPIIHYSTTMFFIQETCGRMGNMGSTSKLIQQGSGAAGMVFCVEQRWLHREGLQN